MQGKARSFKLYANVFSFAMNTKGTLGGFFYHLFSVIYTSLFFAVHFVVTFERLTKHFSF